MKKTVKSKYFKRKYGLIKKYSTEAYQMSDYEATVFSIIEDNSMLKDHCFTGSTRFIEEETGKCRRTILRALKRLEENKVIIKFKTSTIVPYYVPRDLYYARIYHRIKLKTHYPDNVLNLYEELEEFKNLYQYDQINYDKAIESTIRKLKADEINIEKELKSAEFLPHKNIKPTFF